MNETWWIKPEQLDDDQKEVISLAIDRSYLILGPPGSGKTNLLLLRANYLAKAGYPNILILAFGRTLREFVATGASKYRFSTTKIMTSCKWMLSVLRQHDINLELSSEFEELRKQLLSGMQDLAEKRNLSDLFEVILLDEAQDYLPGEIELFNRLGKRLFAVADSRQKIYTGEDPLGTLTNIVGKPYKLRHHYRNGVNICKLADGIAKQSEDYEPLAATSNYDESAMPSSVEIVECVDLHEQSVKILKKVKPQLKAYPGEYIGIVCPRHEELQRLWAHISQSPLGSIASVQDPTDRYVLFGADKPVVVCTIHAAKGLEFRALHIAGFEFIKKFAKQRNMAFTAITRVKTSLSVYHSGGLPGYFEQAYVNMNRPPDMPRLEELFGQKEH